MGLEASQSSRSSIICFLKIILVIDQPPLSKRKFCRVINLVDFSMIMITMDFSNSHTTDDLSHFLIGTISAALSLNNDALNVERFTVALRPQK